MESPYASIFADSLFIRTACHYNRAGGVMTRKDNTKAARPTPKLPTVEEAKRRAITQTAIDMVDLAVLMNVHPATAVRAAARDDLPVPATRIGQRWVIPTAGVRALLGLEESA
jgi:hypothetical protein